MTPTLSIYVDGSFYEFLTDVNYEVLNDGLQVTGTGPKPASHKYSYSGANTLLGYSTSSSAVSPDTNFSVGDTGTIALSNTTISLYSVQQEPVDITISYKGSTIATMSASGTKTLLTEGKYCEDDIIIDYTKTGITVVETLDSHGGTIVSISGDPVTLQTKTIMPTASTQIISPDSGYNGFASVIVNGDNNLVSSNIASGVSIFGVVGTFQGGGGGAASFIQSHETMTSYEDSTVTTIGQGVFAWCNRLQTVSFPACTSIGNSAFYFCSNLQTVSFPSCTSIGSYAFHNCTRLTTASFPNCTNIGNYAFYSCSSLQTANFPACTNIGGSVFYFCSRLTTASFPSCTSIGKDAFALCSSLQTASFPACTSIGGGAFRNCSNLLILSFPVCTNIGGSAFNYCSRLMTVSFPNCTNIDTCAFYYCSWLTSVNFPSCTTISAYAFNSCWNLERISFPNCTYIGNYAFGFCSDLETASFPKCEFISSCAFYSCGKLLSLYLTGSSVVSLHNSNAFTSTPIAGYTTSTSGVYGNIYVPSSLLTAYRSATNWSFFWSRLAPILN